MIPLPLLQTDGIAFFKEPMHHPDFMNSLILPSKSIFDKTKMAFDSRMVSANVENESKKLMVPKTIKWLI